MLGLLKTGWCDLDARKDEFYNYNNMIDRNNHINHRIEPHRMEDIDVPAALTE